MPPEHEPKDNAAEATLKQRLLEAASNQPVETVRPAERVLSPIEQIWEAERAAVAAEFQQRTTPKAMEIGSFEAWLLAHYRLEGEEVLNISSGRRLKFYRVAGGYMAARVPYLNWIKSVLEHRLKFLLAHRWLPTTIDHVNGVRDDNHLSNLAPSTPALQTEGVQRRKNPLL